VNVYQLLNFIWMILKAQIQTVGTRQCLVACTGTPVVQFFKTRRWNFTFPPLFPFP